jgi:hypothetical protein
MRDQGIYLLGTSVLQDTSGQSDSMSSVDHVIHQDCDLALDISNKQFHLFNNGALFFLVD